jgi:LysR family transcriptional regulator, hca operon transcriptional activator
MGRPVELRHLRYFIAVAEEGSVTLAARRRLHTAQPSLSRQLRDLEREVGARLFVRSVEGVQLTPAGRAFLDHARLALSQVSAAGEAARRAADPVKPVMVMGFLIGTEMIWFAEAVRVLRDELPNIEVRLISQDSPDLAEGLRAGRVDIAFLRPEPNQLDLAYKHLLSEPLLVILPGDHPLATRDAISPSAIAGEIFIGMAAQAPTLRAIIDRYLDASGVRIAASHEASGLSNAISLVASTRGITLLPAFALNFLPQSVVGRPLAGTPPTIDLVLGYHKANTSPLLRLFLSRTDELVARVSRRSLTDER